MAEVVVVGAGLAGARTCAVLRTAGVTGRVVLLGAEPEPPYDRPPLTKDPDAEVDLRTAMGLDVFGLADDVRLGVRAEALLVEPGSPGRLVLACSDGADVEARAVVVATGASAILPGGWKRPGVHVLHTRAEAGSFWGAVGSGVHVVVVGGGWVGCEAAATAAARGAHVDLVEAGGQVLAGHVPAQVSQRVAAWLAESGVQVHTGHPVQGIEDAQGALLVAGVPADLVLAAMGVQPATAWLVGSGIEGAAGGAVRVDPWGRSAVPGVFALGDAAARWSPRYRTHLPGGHWTEALNAPETVGAAVAEWLIRARRAEWWGSAPNVPAADAIPYVFSDIAQRTLLVLGAPGTGRVVWREVGGAAPPGSEAWSAFTLDASDRLLGLCTSGRPRDLAAARRAMRAHPTGTPRTVPGALADPDAGPDAMFPGEG
ncbi:MAG TPA: NAD(P)/FAD-dependent oxidoreductase [Motilibacterales bacterium]|nr:NAD(P)/FAD-dependent oxidoreductase [Motilibacterales bacterium]